MIGEWVGLHAVQLPSLVRIILSKFKAKLMYLQISDTTYNKPEMILRKTFA